MPVDSRRIAYAVIALLLVASFAVAVFVQRTPLLWLSAVVLLALVYFGWRIVRAAERIAMALESE